MDVEWLDPWWPKTGKDEEFHEVFKTQLLREVSCDHPLYALSVRLIARGNGDDSLFAILD